MTRTPLALLIALALLLAAPLAAAAEETSAAENTAAQAPASAPGLDGSQGLRCTLDGSAQCDADAACIPVTLEQIDLSGVLLVDFANSQLAAEGSDRTSPIDDVDVLDGVLVLQGHQNGRGWTMVIDRASGHLSAALAETAGAFVLAGECAAN